MPEVFPDPPRRRFDTAALVFVVALALAATSVVTVAASPFGPAGAWLGRLLLDAAGLALGVACAGWLACLGLYVAGRGLVVLLARVAGWAVLTACGAVAADLYAPASPAVSVYGPGGSLGAVGGYFLTDAATPPLPLLALLAVAVVGLALTLPGPVGWLVWAVGVTLRLLATGGERALNAATKPVADAPIPLEKADPPSAEDIPIIRHAIPPDAEPEPGEEVEDVPIHRHAEPPSPAPPTPLPPTLRVVPREAFDDPVDVTAEPPSVRPDGYERPSLSLLADPDPFPIEDHEQRLRDKAALLEKTFTDFGLNIRVVGIHTGPVITQYEIALETGLRLNKVTALADDIALNLGAPSVRIVPSLPGRSTMGVEVPNDHRQTVRLKELIQATTAKVQKYKLPIYLGKDVEGRSLVYDMATMPHLLIAGRTGTGKSVCLNAIIQSFLLTRDPDECRLILIDPKKVEFSDYAHIPHLMHPVVTDDKKAEAILAWAVDKMEDRYELLRKARVRNIASYNELTWDELIRRIDPQTEDERKAIPRKMPYIVLVVDEVGDLIMSMKKEVETHIIRLAQKSRASGIHLILATQRPTVDVITGLIKSNLPARICFQVASRSDSMVVLDEKGAEKLLGMGDMLFLQPGTSTIIRGQGTYVDDREIERITTELSQYEPNFEGELLNLKAKDGPSDLGEKLRDRDPMYEQAIEVVLREQRGSTSLLQRALGIGYGRASRLIDFMTEDGLLGGFNGSSARDVLVTSEEWELRKQGA